MYITMRQLAIRLNSWINFYKRAPNMRYGLPEEDITPRETDLMFGRYFIA